MRYTAIRYYYLETRLKLRHVFQYLCICLFVYLLINWLIVILGMEPKALYMVGKLYPKCYIPISTAH